MRGVDTWYDAAGQRVRTLRSFMDRAWIDPGGFVNNSAPPSGEEASSLLGGAEAAMFGEGYWLDFINEREELFYYDSAGRLDYAHGGDGWVDNTNGDYQGVLSGAMADFSYDLMGRLTQQIDYAPGAGTQQFKRTLSYNAKGQIVSDTSETLRAGVTYKAVASNDYGIIGTNAATSTYALGSPLSVTTDNSEKAPGASVFTLKSRAIVTNAYLWRDGPQQSSVNHKLWNASGGVVNTSGTPAQNNSSTYLYDIIGGQAQLKMVNIADGRPRKVYFVNDFLGQGIKRDEADALAGGDPHELWYRFGGRSQGYVGNNGTIDTDYAKSIADRTATSGAGAFHNGAATGSSFADFDLAYDAINSYEQGSRGGTYTVQAGDTLAGIASALWGDASLWYKLAEVNGLTAESALIEGQPLLIPVGVVRNTNNASTFQPYDPLEVLGETAPTTPVAPKPKKNKCGMFGAIILVIIAAVVTAFTYGATSEFFVGALGNMGGAIAAGAVSGAVGSIASQAVGVATGIQEKFSWNAVALSAISAGVTKGLGKLKVFGGAGAGATQAEQAAHLLRNAPSFVQQAGLAMSASAITQGIGVATGLQKEFSWAGVAGAGVGAALGGWVGRRVGGNVGAILASSADAIGDAATRSLIEGSDFGDNIIAALPSVIGNALANGLIGAMTREEELTPVAQIEAETLEPSASLDLSALSAQLPTFERVGSNGSFWKVAERTLPAGASDAQVRARVLELMAANPTLDPMHMDANNYVTIPSGAVSVDATTLANYNAADAQYRVNLAARAVEADADSMGAVFRHMAEHEAPRGAVSAAGARFTPGAHYARGLNDSIQGSVTQPIMSASRWFGLWFSEPDQASRRMSDFFEGASDSIERAAKTDPFDVADAVADGYRESYEMGGWSAVGNRMAYQGGFLTPMVGPMASEMLAARAGLGAEEIGTLANLTRVRFTNRFPEDIPRPANIIPNDRLMTINQRRLGYVVLDDGTLVVGKNGRASGQGHVDLAQGQPVLAAGEFRVLNGDLVYIDNWSGHYRPSGASAQFQAENAFRRLGFDVRGKYTERRFD